MECTGRFFFLDGAIYPVGDYDDFSGGEVAFYEVIRTRNGVPIFFEDHIKRLRDGITTRYELNEDIGTEVRKGLNALIRSERHEEINLRVTVTFTGRDYSLHICYVPSRYPSGEMVSEGVSLILYHAERFDPGVKLLNNRLRLSVNGELSRRGAYEALLVNHEGFITEGSRSNIFFVTAEGTVHTAPDSMVLSGITRRYVTDIIGNEGIPLVYEAVKADSVGRFRSAFLTGTSPMVIAVKSIGGTGFDASDPLIGRLRGKYTSLLERSISEYIEKNEEE